MLAINRMDAIRYFLDRRAGHTVFKIAGLGSSAACSAGFITGLSLGYDLRRACDPGTAAILAFPAADLFSYFFLVLFFPFFPRLFLRILMLQVLFQLTFAIRPPSK